MPPPPAINVFETEKEYKVELVALNDQRRLQRPYRRRKQLGHQHGRRKKRKNKEAEEGRYLRREFSYTKFQQTMILPDDVDKEKDFRPEKRRIEHRLAEAEQEKKRPKDSLDVKIR